ncbi:coagulation factor 5/8 type domain-containing protein [Pedobacter sp. SD-b]|uniref:Coagulation factor 5/8 type domain-containing protein n=1 Tax=Pedobacter segetis TaxID=2793069 RepID=A0ABS1BHJ4_9SPHI|nr:chondroitinase-B domain-containing protein [Pedobacter segetis]MBK0382355.1 coagulation factor 5/8 type domain-containing protein [Pedobacter segetis]
MIQRIYLLLLPVVIISCSQKAVITKAEIKRNLINVANSQELKNVLDIAKPGDSIVLKDGIYDGKFIITASNSGTSTQPITLVGSRNVILDGGSKETGYVLSLQANYWRIKGFSIRNGLKGIVADGANHNLIDGIIVTQIGEEAIHLRKFSKHNTIQNSEITYTGLKTPDYGEGIYIGSAVSNWAKYSDGQPDKCDSNKVLNNKIGPYVAAECIDIKEGTTGGLIKGNTFEAQGITGANSADSWIDVKGNHYLIEDNTGFNTQPSVLLDGFQINCAASGWGSYNEFKNNICNVNSSGFGFNVRLKSSKGEAVGNKIYSNNKVINAASGVANVPLSN